MHLDSGITIVDMIVHYDNCIVRLHENEAHDDCTNTQTALVPILDECKDLEKSAAREFSAANFYIL